MDQHLRRVIQGIGAVFSKNLDLKIIDKVLSISNNYVYFARMLAKIEE